MALLIRGGVFPSLMLLVAVYWPCEGGYTPLYGSDFAVSYNDSSGILPSRRFPSQDVLSVSEYEYFSKDIDIDSIISNSVVVGGKNVLYQLDLNLDMQSKFSWDVNATVEEACVNAGNQRYICQNHIRSVHRIPSATNRLLVCGTQADRTPQCLALDISSNALGAPSLPITVSDGLVSFYVDSPGFGEFIDAAGTGAGNMDNRFFSAAYGDNTRDFLMSYQNVNYDPSANPPLTVNQSFRTRATDNFWLRSPVTFVDFVRMDYPSVASSSFYFVFLRENFELRQRGFSIETITSRVVRLCRNDPGSTTENYFESFIKSEIFCELEAPSNNRSVNTIDFTYRELTSMAFNSQSGGRYSESANSRQAMYGAFVGTNIGPAGSAICIYAADTNSQDSVYRVFTEDVLDYNPPLGDGPLPQVQNGIPTCATTRSDQQARYRVESIVRIAQIGANPILVLGQYRITQMLVDSQCVVRSGSATTACLDQDILLLGTGRGTILKVLFATTADRQIDPVIAEEISLEDSNSIKDMKLQTINNSKVVFATTDSRVYRVPLERCGRHDRCSTCIDARDPYCVWNTDSQLCEVSTLVSSQAVANNFRQNVHTISTYPTVFFPELNYTIVESQSVLMVTLNITTPQSEAVLVEVTSRDGSATAGLDYMAVNMNVTIAAQQTLVTFPVNILNDQILEAGDESFSLHIRGLGSVCVLTGDAATVTIQDNNSAIVGVMNSELEVAEGGATAELRVSSGVQVSEVDISFYAETADISATAPSDYSALSRTLFTIPSGSSNMVNITIPIVNDAILEANETFVVTLSLAENPSLGSRVSIGNSKATVTIRDDDNVQVGFDSASYDVSEQNSMQSLTLRILKVGSNQIPVTISTNLESATADNGTDFLFYPGDITFSSSDTVQEIQVSILPDMDIENVENFTIALQSDSSNVQTLSGQDRATVVIQDNDVRVSWVMASRNVTTREGDGSILLSIEASGNLEEPVSVSVAASNGQATASSDYTFTSTSVQLTSESPVTTVSVLIVDDSVFERDVESFTVALSGGGSRVQLQDNVATVNIIDNDVVMVEFVEASRAVVVDENVGTVVLTVRSLGGAMDEPVTVAYTTESGTATGNSDFTSASGTMQISGGGMATINVAILNDSVYESSMEEFTVSLSTENSRVQLVSPRATVTVRDNDDFSLVLEFAGSPAENDSFVELLITKPMANEVPVEFVVSTTSITATRYSDYAPLESLATSFSPSMSSSTMTLQVTIVDDQMVEGPETFDVNMTSRSPRVAATLPQSTVTIIDNDVFIVGFESSSYSAEEGTVLPVKVIRQGSGSLTVTVNVMGTTATSVVDFSLQAPNVTFTNDEVEKILYVDILNDIVYEELEKFELTLAPGGPNLRLNQNQAVITIIDITVVEVAFDQNEYLIREDRSPVVLVVNRTAVTLATSFALQLRAISQTALNQEDYMSSNVPLTFSAGSSTSEQYAISIVNDEVYEVSESFLVIMSSEDSRVSISAMSSTTVVIMDDDLLRIRFTSTVYTAIRGSVIPVVVFKQGSIGLPVTVNISVTTIAASSINFNYQPQVVTFSPDQSEQQINLVIQSNKDARESETFVLNLIPRDTRVIIENSANVTIEDVSVLSIGFVRSEYTVDENEGSVDLLVSRNASTPIAVEVRVISQSAIADEDYRPPSVFHTLDDADLTDAIPIQILDDNFLEKSSETFTVVLTTTAPGVVVQGISNAIVTIVDNDNNTFQFKENDIKVQNGKTQSVTINRVGMAMIPVLLVVSAQLESSSMSPWNSTVVFEPGQMSASVVVPTDDILDGKPGTFSLSLSVGSGSEEIRNRISIGTSGSSNALATINVEPNDVSVVGTDGLRTCSAVAGSSTFIAVLVVLLAVVIVLVAIILLLIICFYVHRERNKTYPRKRTVSPYGRETSTTVLNNMNASEDSPDGSPGSIRSDEKDDLSEKTERTRETNIDDADPFEHNTSHVIHTTTSDQSSKEPSEQHDRSTFQYSPSPTSLDTSTRTQSNGNELTVM